MKYKSEIINEIIENQGHTYAPIHYESECIDSWIEEVKGAYPKLCDYESEWLNYLVENPIGNFPYKSLTDVTEATVNNVVPYAYKSAILSGQTLVNIFPTKSATYSSSTTGQIRIFTATKLAKPIPVNGKAIFLYDNIFPYDSQNGFIQLYKTNENNLPAWIGAINFIKKSNGKNYIIISNTYDSEITHIDFYISNGVEGKYALDNMMVIEYQQGMENWDIPYFEGMQSVKMPVLTTSNEDGTKTNILTVNEDVELGSVGEVKDELNLLTGQLTQRTETRAYQEGDESNSEVITDMANTRYKLPKESIKTVDLMITNQDGETLSRLKPIEGTMHISTDGQDVKPTFSAEIPVEAIKQNLSSFIEG